MPVVNWSPLTTGLNFVSDSESRLLIGAAPPDTSPTLAEVQTCSWINQIIAETNRRSRGLFGALGYLTISTRPTIGLINTIRSITNQVRNYEGQSAYTFVEDVTDRNIHAILVELRTALNTPYVVTSTGETRQMTRNLVVESVDFATRVGKTWSSIGGPTGSAKRYRVIKNAAIGSGVVTDARLTINFSNLEQIGEVISSVNIYCVNDSSDFDNFGTFVGSFDPNSYAEAVNFDISLIAGSIFTVGGSIFLLFVTDNELTGTTPDSLNQVSSMLGISSGSSSLTVSMVVDEN